MRAAEHAGRHHRVPRGGLHAVAPHQRGLPARVRTAARSAADGAPRERRAQPGAAAAAARRDDGERGRHALAARVLAAGAAGGGGERRRGPGVGSPPVTREASPFRPQLSASFHVPPSSV